MQFVIDDVVDQLKTDDIALIDWVYLKRYLCPSSEKLKSDDRDKIFDEFINIILKKSNLGKIRLYSEKAQFKYLSQGQFKYQERSHMLYIAPKKYARKVNFVVGVSSPYVWPQFLLLLIPVVISIFTFFDS